MKQLMSQHAMHAEVERVREEKRFLKIGISVNCFEKKQKSRTFHTILPEEFTASYRKSVYIKIFCQSERTCG